MKIAKTYAKKMKLKGITYLDANDASQIMVIRVFQCLDSFDSKISPFDAWCCMIAKSTIGETNRYAHAKKRKPKAKILSVDEGYKIKGDSHPIEIADPTNWEKIYDDTEIFVKEKILAEKILAENFSAVEAKVLRLKCEGLSSAQILLRLPEMTAESTDKKRSKDFGYTYREIKELLEKCETFQEKKITSKKDQIQYNRMRKRLQKTERLHPEKMTPGLKSRWEKIKAKKWCHPRKVPTVLIKKIRELKDSGLNATQISEIVGLSSENTRRIWLRHSRYLPPQTPPVASGSNREKNLTTEPPEKMDAAKAA
jgi:DNA-directed RNA polymerase specialized sigma24 family protein